MITDAGYVDDIALLANTPTLQQVAQAPVWTKTKQSLRALIKEGTSSH